ncbi:helix-turn-helix domain-containing protein [Streptomyces sp. G1]|uniref:helix-turn-helix domain-containing protein n=1 Tax=Streptomyces sp. G1 TaxID=361572 RepID=UPI002030B610|nr:helix-turn-helix transcriptional regulator [Streptomyces sp. G1]MCM1964915.1 helix-turn-helix domain-containing protein [Streptomyces sp. G1]
MVIRLRTDKLEEQAALKGDRTQLAIAERIGVTESTIYRLFAGQATPRVATLVKFNEAYGVALHHLIRRETEAVTA